MGGGNGAKAKMARERNAAAAAGGPKSQLKSNEAAKGVVCTVCKMALLNTANQPTLNEHASKHDKTGLEAFGDAYTAAKPAKAKK